MNYLFEIHEKRTEHKRPEPEKDEPIAPKDESRFEAPVVLGRADDLFDCGFCGGRCHDVIDEYKGLWKVECGFCGLVETHSRVDGVLPEVFTFPGGRFAGQSIESVASTDKGMRFVRWSALEHENNAVKEACKKFLDTLNLVAYDTPQHRKEPV